MKSGGGETSTTEVRKEQRSEEVVSEHFSEKKSRSLILPRPPTGPLPPTGLLPPAPGTLPASSAVPIAIKGRAAPGPSCCGGLAAAPAPHRVPARSLCCGFCSPTRRFFLGSVSCWPQSKRVGCWDKHSLVLLLLRLRVSQPQHPTARAAMFSGLLVDKSDSFSMYKEKTNSTGVLF